MFNSSEFSDDDYLMMYEHILPATISSSTYKKNLEKLGYVDPEDPDTIDLYVSTFENKDKIADIIAKYNEGKDEKDQITYTDYVALLMSSVTTIISAISYVLMAFVAISLIVSSIMIGIITYISVIERTKEIGILRSIGASKRDISRVFNAETFMVGLAAGVLHRCAEVVSNVDHAHVGLGVVGFGFGINRHLRFSFTGTRDNGHTESYSALPHDEAASAG